MYSNGLVVILGLGIVFAGLIGVILICYIMSAAVSSATKEGRDNKTPARQETAPAAALQAAAPEADLDKNKKMIAIILTVLSEELGTSPADIEIKRITKI